MTVEFDVPGSFGIWLIDQETLELTEIIFGGQHWAVFPWHPGKSFKI